MTGLTNGNPKTDCVMNVMYKKLRFFYFVQLQHFGVLIVIPKFHIFPNFYQQSCTITSVSQFTVCHNSFYYRIGRGENLKEKLNFMLIGCTTMKMFPFFTIFQKLFYCDDKSICVENYVDRFKIKIETKHSLYSQQYEYSNLNKFCI